MTVKELKQVANEMHKAGYSDEVIINGFASMYLDNKITADEFNGIVNIMGYHLTDDFLKLNDKQKRAFIKESFKVKK